MTPTNALTGRALDYAVGVAVNGVYSPAKADRKAGWFWPRTSITTHGYSRIAPVFHDDPKWIPKLGQLPESACLSCAQKESGQHHLQAAK